jgi:Asp-tRNA(Asn)/Glu-tRNA(Gln) amidotransferase C subunit
MERDLLKVDFFSLFNLVIEIRTFHRVAKDLPLEIIEKELKHFEKAFEDHFEYAKKVIDYFETTGIYIELLKRLIEEKRKAREEVKGVCDE